MGALPILVAEDNPADLFLVRTALRISGVVNEVVAFSEGESLLKYVESIEAGQADCPEMLLLDINLPRYSGTEILERFRLGRCTEVPAIVITSSDSPKDRAEAARLGVLHYFRKPQDYEEFMKIGGIVRRALGGK